MATPHSPTQNHLLAALPAAEFKRLSSHLKLVPMPLGEALYESGTALGHVYFPTTSIVSLLYNRHHSVEQQLCWWLPLSLDRLSTDSLNMTQELIAKMLGVRRQGVTEAAGRLQHAGLIHDRRGHIDVRDRPGSEKAVCECCAVVKRELDRLLAHIPPSDPAHIPGKSAP